MLRLRARNINMPQICFAVGRLWCESAHHSPQIVLSLDKHVMSRGKRSSQLRSAAWRSRSERCHAQRRVIDIELTSLVTQARMKKAADRCTEIIPVMCECLKTSNKPWLRALWRRMCDQYRTRDVDTIARQWQTMMKSKARFISSVCLIPPQALLGKWNLVNSHTRD